MVAKNPRANAPDLTVGTGIYAKFTTDSATVEITFNLNYDNSKPIVVEAAVGSYVDATADPVHDGYEFNGWFNTATTRDGSEFDVGKGECRFDVLRPLGFDCRDQCREACGTDQGLPIQDRRFE
ncbi:hypothetical protein [Bifidobacterium pullorum]|uniref:hypothetical protein n=1 Tax=Bifidobacterium pullorum TaxID=78448 RepID=UPI003F28CF17